MSRPAVRLTEAGMRWSPATEKGAPTVEIDWCIERGEAVLGCNGVELAASTAVRLLSTWAFNRGAAAVLFTATAAEKEAGR